MYDTVKALESIHRVTFLSYRVSKLTAGITNIQPRTLGTRWRIYHPGHLWRLLANDTDLLILKHINDPINLIPYLLCWLKGIQCLVVVQRVSHPRFLGYKFMYTVLLVLLRSLGVKVMCVTEASYAEVNRDLPHSSYIPACINPLRFSSRPATNASTNELRLLTIAKYQPRKNIPLLVESLAILVRKYSAIKFHLTVIGALGSNAQRLKEYQRICDLIKHQRLTAAVSLLKDLPYEVIAHHYQASDLFVLPAVSEPLGYAVLEAMAAGLPILCSADVGAASYIEPGKNGYIFSTQSTSSIVTAVEEFTSRHVVNQGKISTYGQHSKRLVQQEHAPEVFLNRFQALLGWPS